MPEECVICLRNIMSHRSHVCVVYDIVLPCGHGFHFKCLSKWLNTSNTCPTCRKDIESDIYNIAFDTTARIIDSDCDTEYIPEVNYTPKTSKKCRHSKRMAKKLYNLRTR